MLASRTPKDLTDPPQHAEVGCGLERVAGPGGRDSRPSASR